MNRDDFFQQAMLKMVEMIMLRSDTTPSPEQLGKKAREYAVELHNQMLAGAVECDIYWMGVKPYDPPAEDAFDNGPPPAPTGSPVLYPGGRLEAPVMPPCPRCGAEMKKRNGSNGIFLGCTKYPECRGTMNLPR